MAFNNFEESEDQGEPIQLFLFQYGLPPSSGPHVPSVFAYTDHTHDVVVDGVTYVSRPIKANTFANTAKAEKDNLAVTVSNDLPLCDLFRGFPPTSPVGLVIKEGHYSDPDHEFLAVWSGQVKSAKRSAEKMTFSCESVGVTMERTGLRRHYQLSCPHTLYGDRCRADRVAAKSTVSVVAVAGAHVDLSPGWNALPVESYIRGTLEWDGPSGRQIHTIQGSTGTSDLILAYAPSGLSVGMVVDVFLGCTHLQPECRSLHNNILNFGGQPFIPTENIVNKNPHN